MVGHHAEGEFTGRFIWWDNMLRVNLLAQSPGRTPELMSIIAHVPYEFHAPNPSKFQPWTATNKCQIFLKRGLMVRITRTSDPSEFHED